MAEYIEREELIARLKRDLDACNTGTIEALCFRGAIMIAQRLPTADVAPVVHGRWEIVLGSNNREHMVCSHCRKQQELTGVFSYCPNCGAKMDGDEADAAKAQIGGGNER